LKNKANCSGTSINKLLDNILLKNQKLIAYSE